MPAIIVPTHKRSNILTTAIEGQILLVHESEKEDYKDQPYEIQTHNKNKLSEIRQFAYETHGEVFMVDDDIEAVVRLIKEPDQPAKLTPEEARKLIEETAYLAKQVGASPGS